MDEFITRCKDEPPLLPARQVAQLLSAAGKNRELQQFLPDIETAIRDDDREALNLLSRYYVAEHAAEPKTETLEMAWRVTQAVLATGKVKKKQNGRLVLSPKHPEPNWEGWVAHSLIPELEEAGLNFEVVEEGRVSVKARELPEKASRHFWSLARFNRRR